MWIVALALRRPYTFIVMALLILILTPVVVLRTPTDIFPEINIPVISIVWNTRAFLQRKCPIVLPRQPSVLSRL